MRLFPLALLTGLLSVPVLADNNAANNGNANVDSNANSSADEVLLPDDSPLKTTLQQVEVIDPQELPEAVRNLPTLVEKIQVERAAANSRYVLLPHRPNYILPLTYQSRPNPREWERLVNELSNGQAEDPGEFDHVEAMFQISIKYLLAEGLVGKHSTLEVGYTNRSFWQAYNSEISRPFRETNHEPELILSWRPKHIDWLEQAGLALNHQSNGQTSSLSRSWNRVIFHAASIVGDGIWYLRAWWRIPEESSADPFDPSDNDNPDIDDYMGPGELSYLHVMDQHNFSVTLRNNLNFDENRGALQLEWSFPMTKRLKGYMQYFNGYGESLIDYDRYQERFGIGIQLSGWL
ncbi:phospholipase A [Bacterioplanoides pacificum]|uniref:Phospholipase A1 n=1 Tax=Bacterioplanoides pacificum TaxID=1171596 RepID=A0ABV7VUM2_9GAMM